MLFIHLKQFYKTTESESWLFKSLLFPDRDDKPLIRYCILVKMVPRARGLGKSFVLVDLKQSCTSSDDPVIFQRKRVGGATCTAQCACEGYFCDVAHFHLHLLCGPKKLQQMLMACICTHFDGNVCLRVCS